MIRDTPLARLVKFFTDAPSSIYRPEDIAIAFGEARIRYRPHASDLDVTGHVDRALYARLMLDAATLAAGSMIDSHFVVNESFNTYGMKAAHDDLPLAAIARLVHAEDDRYTVEVRLLDAKGTAIASGTGLFSRSPVALNDEPPEAAVDEPEEMPEETGIAYGSIWRTPFGYIHQN